MKFKKELNPILETIGLCCYIKYKDDICEETVEALNRLGVDGQLFYDHNYPLINQYADDFATKYEPHIDEEVLFGSMDRPGGSDQRRADSANFLRDVCG